MTHPNPIEVAHMVNRHWATSWEPVEKIAFLSMVLDELATPDVLRDARTACNSLPPDLAMVFTTLGPAAGAAGAFIHRDDLALLEAHANGGGES